MGVEPPVITIIMPVFNAERYLKDAIDSVINQSYKFWELICVNDGSTDNSHNILKEYEASDNRIIVLDKKNSGSASGARNKALDNARGKFIHMLDSDDLLSEDCLEKTYEIAAITKADFVIPDLIFFKNGTNYIIRRLIGYDGNREILLSSKDAFIASLTWKISGVGLYRTELLRKFRYDETGMNGDEYSTRVLLLNCNKIAFCSGIYYYRKHPDSTTSKISPKRFDNLTTDFRILQLAYDYKMGKIAIMLCKKRIVENIIHAERFYLQARKHFTATQKKDIQIFIKKNYKKVKKSFIAYEGNIFKYLILKVLLMDFRILKMYSFGINILTYLLKENIEFRDSGGGKKNLLNKKHVRINSNVFKRSDK
jgi:glycosyltransferase involved in cell wall biosynthesis